MTICQSKFSFVDKTGSRDLINIMIKRAVTLVDVYPTAQCEKPDTIAYFVDHGFNGLREAAIRYAASHYGSGQALSLEISRPPPRPEYLSLWFTNEAFDHGVPVNENALGFNLPEHWGLRGWMFAVRSAIAYWPVVDFEIDGNLALEILRQIAVLPPYAITTSRGTARIATATDEHMLAFSMYLLGETSA